MAWCLSRAVKSCQTQQHPVSQIILVDDCSTDETNILAQDLTHADKRIKYIRQPQNRGHLQALERGLAASESYWTVLLDADDELTQNSVKDRIVGAFAYQKIHAELPQLVYGDQQIASGGRNSFRQLQGNVFPFLCKELCLCQTSTMMIGKEGASCFPKSSNPWNTDDEIALAIGRDFPVLHCGQIVAIYHTHQGVTRMSNDPNKVYRGVRQLVWDHRTDIVKFHGRKCYFLWKLRVIKAFLRCRLAVVNEDLNRSTPSSHTQYTLRAKRKIYYALHTILSAKLNRYFELDYF